MTTRISPLVAATAALASAGALVAATPAIGTSLAGATASAARINSLVAPFELLSKSEWNPGAGVKGHDESDDDEHESDVDNDRDEGDDHDGGQIGNVIADFLANNQAQVLAVTAQIPVFNLGPVAVGNSLLATAYYDGYNGSAPGIDGVISYVTSQLGGSTSDIVESVVLAVTGMIPQFDIGPVAVGNSLLATAYFSGYNGSATGLPGVISYVTSQLGLQPAPAAVVAGGPVVQAVATKSVSAPAAAVTSAAAARSAPAAPAASGHAGEVSASEAAQDAGTPAGHDDAGGSTDDAANKAATGVGRPGAHASARAAGAHVKARTSR